MNYSLVYSGLYHDCKLCSIFHNINENMDQIQKLSIKTALWWWALVTFPISFCSYSPAISINMCFPYTFVRTEYNKNIFYKSTIYLCFIPLSTVCYFLAEVAELTWCYFYLKNSQWLPFNSLLESWTSYIV